MNITSYSILNVHQVFMLIEISKIHIGGYAIIKTGRRKNGLTFNLLLFVIYWSIFFRIFFAFDFNGTYSLSL